MNYQLWNKKIFEYFFNKNNANKEVLFCVDEDVLLKIGEEFNIVKHEILDNFCKVVSEQLLYLNSKNENVIRLNKIRLEISEDIPSQTAIIAFFIFAASKMGKDKHISNRNYYLHLKSLSEKFYDKPIQKGFRVNDREKYFEIYNHFENYLNNEMNGKFGKVRFEKLFQKVSRKREDWIGIPIFQSMISRKDRALLTNFFDTAQNNRILISDLPISKFSQVFKTMAHHEKYKYILENKINFLYENWDGQVCEIDEKTNEERYILTPKLLYTKARFGFSFYEIIKYKKNMNEFIFDNKIYSKSSNFENYYNPVVITTNDINLQSKEITVNNKFKIRYPKRDFILLKKSEVFEGYYIECNSAEIGDNISIISTPAFFKKNSLLINSITDNIVKPIFIDENLPHLMIIDSIKVLKESRSLNIFAKDKIFLKKGLRNGHKFEYLKKAEPLLFFSNNVNKIITFFIDGKIFETNSGYPFDLRICNNSVGTHYISTQNENSLNYKIIDKIEEKPFEPIFKYFDKTCIRLTSNPAKHSTNLINGCHIQNYKPVYNLNKDFKKYKILTILKAISKKRNNKKFYNPNKNICYKFNKNFENSKFTDNIELKYLQVLQE